MAREVSQEDLRIIAAEAACEIEVFIHGAICISMSGRCLISSYMTGRDANKGECTHPCRWKYALMEETRPGSYYPVYEDERGTYLYNSKDLRLLERIGNLEKMGIKSGKIEGRMKSLMYVSVVTGVYRAAIDRAKEDADGYCPEESWRNLLDSVSNRGYTEGFFGSESHDDAMNRDTGGYRRGADFLGVVTDCKNGEITISAKAKFIKGETVSVFEPGLKRTDITLDAIYDDKGAEVENTRPNYVYKFKFSGFAEQGSLLMRF